MIANTVAIETNLVSFQYKLFNGFGSVEPLRPT